MIIMLYDEALKHLDIGKEILSAESGDLESAHKAIVKAQDIITELMVSLDFDKGGDIAKTLFNLYMFFNKQLMEANVKKDPSVLTSIRGLLSELRSAWAEIIVNSAATGGGVENGINIAG